MKTQFTDQEIITVLKQQDSALENQVLRQLYLQYYGIIDHLIHKNSGKEDDTKQVFHDGLISFISKAKEDSFHLTSSIKTYLYSTCRNLWLYELRKRRNIKEIHLIEDVQWKSMELNTHKKLELDEGNDLLHLVLNKIEGNCLKIIELFYFAGKRMKEIMKELGVDTEDAMKARKLRCMKKLKSVIKNDENYHHYLQDYLESLKSTHVQ